MLLLIHVQHFATPWTAARQAFQSFTISRSLLKLMSIESEMPSNHLILCLPLLLLPSIFPNIKSFQMSRLFILGGHIGTSASASLDNLLSSDCFLFLHVLTSLMKLILWLKFFHRQKAGRGHHGVLLRSSLSPSMFPLQPLCFAGC